ncbi:hypothetical protein T492DRAFT_1096980 [Pavlovales sp. CCMP2436]|nr:hypothetical protein T492DRAFT_1096980 [Pavlovales sp. CCMP2436]
MLLGTEERTRAQEDESSASAFDELDIAKLGASTGSLYLSILGRVYDVSRGSRFYGPGASYAAFAGRDASALLCTGCVTNRCLLTSVTKAAAALARGGERQHAATRTCALEAERWLEFFETHDKYPFIGLVQSHRALARALSPRPGEAGSADESERPLAFLRLGLHALLGPRVPTHSREVLVELVLADAAPASLSEPAAAESEPATGRESTEPAEPVEPADEPADEPAAARREPRAEAEREAREDLLDVLQAAEAGDGRVGLRVVARVLELRGSADAARGPAYPRVAAVLAEVSAELAIGSLDANRYFRLG